MTNPIIKGIVKPRREACCIHCGVPFSPAAISQPCKEGHAHYFEIRAS